MLKVVDISDASLAFPSDLDGIIPKYEDIPEEFKQSYGGDDKVKKCRDLFSTWFYRGLKTLELIPKEGVDKDKALRMIRCVMGSFSPKHEHKEAACAYMFHEFFEEIEFSAR